MYARRQLQALVRRRSVGRASSIRGATAVSGASVARDAPSREPTLECTSQARMGWGLWHRKQCQRRCADRDRTREAASGCGMSKRWKRHRAQEKGGGCNSQGRGQKWRTLWSRCRGQLPRERHTRRTNSAAPESQRSRMHWGDRPYWRLRRLTDRA